MTLTDSTGRAHDVQEGRPARRAATAYTKVGAREQAFDESEMRRQGDRWEVAIAPDGCAEEVTGDLTYPEARRRLTDWRRERARRLLAGDTAAG